MSQFPNRGTGGEDKRRCGQMVLEFPRSLPVGLAEEVAGGATLEGGGNVH